MKYLVLLIGLITLLSSCKKDNNSIPANDYLIFGHFYGECMGEGCVEIFKLTDKGLFEDVNDNYPTSLNQYNGDFSIDRSCSLNQVVDLWNVIPEQLFDENNIVIGQPDAGDWGGIYFQYHRDGVNQYWLIDQMEENLPNYLYELVDSINSKIAIINEI